jgi:hypothetical protein
MNYKRSATALAALLVLVTSAAMGVVATTETATDTTTTDRSAVDGESFHTAAAASTFAPDHTGVDKLVRLLDEFDLTENESAAIETELREMHADDATRADLHHAVHYLLYQHGYDTATVHAEAASARLEIRIGLDDARADELGHDVVDMRQDGATRHEIREHVRDRLDDWGVNVGDWGGDLGDDSPADRSDDRPADRLDRALEHLQDRYDLTDDEVAELRELALDMHDDGATRAEITHALVHEARDLGDGDTDRSW